MDKFTHIKIPWLNNNVEISDVTNSDGTRFYTIFDKVKKQKEIFPSITSILKGYNADIIEKWKERVGPDEAKRISKLALGRGNALHSIAEKYLQNQGREKSLDGYSDYKSLFMPLARQLDKHVTNVYCLEQPLYSLKLGVAGRCDCVADWDEIPSILDFKGSGGLKKPEWIIHYCIQTCFYAHAFRMLTGKNIEQCVVLVASDGSKDQEFFQKTKNSNYVKSIGDTIQIFKFPEKDYRKQLVEQVNNYYETH